MTETGHGWIHSIFAKDLSLQDGNSDRFSVVSAVYSFVDGVSWKQLGQTMTDLLATYLCDTGRTLVLSSTQITTQKRVYRYHEETLSWQHLGDTIEGTRYDGGLVND